MGIIEKWKEGNLEKAAKAYERDGLVLALGAGLSVGCNLPSWEELLGRIGERTAGADGRELIGKLKDLGYSPAAVAGIVKALPRQDGSYLELVRNELYRDFEPYKRKLSRPEFVELVSSNKTLRAVAALCARRNENGSHAPNRSVRAIINFNLDAVLRFYTEYRYGTRILRTIERPSATSSSTRINTYHVHGFLQFKLRKRGDPEGEADSIVLAEDEYYDFFGKPFGMFSYTVLHLLREHSCLFIGLSMNDENLRRLLHYSYVERVQSYCAEDWSLIEAQEESRRHFAILPDKGNERLNLAIAASLANLGVGVIVVRDFDEIPDLLARLYATDGEWKDVY